MNRHYTEDAVITFPEDRHRVKVGDLLLGMFVRIICDPCDHLVEIDAADFRKGGDPETQICDLAPRFKCSDCGKVGTRFWDAWRRSSG